MGLKQSSRYPFIADFPGIEGIELSLSKRNPPMGADVDVAGVELHCSRCDFLP